MLGHEDPNKPYPLMVAHSQILEYSIILQQKPILLKVVHPEYWIYWSKFYWSDYLVKMIT